MLVKVRATALYAILDQISRNASPVGVLIGSQSDDLVTVTDVFELKWVQHTIDYEYLTKRLRLLLAVSPNATLVGLYLTTEEPPLEALTDFIRNNDAPPPIYLTFHETKIKCFSSSDHSPLAATIVAEGTETIATKTLHLHANYTKDEPELTQVKEEAVAYSLEQLEQKVRLLLSTEDTTPETERDLVYLMNRLSSAPEASEENLELISSRLAILTNLLSMTRTANAYFAPKTGRS